MYGIIPQMLLLYAKLTSTCTVHVHVHVCMCTELHYCSLPSLSPSAPSLPPSLSPHFRATEELFEFLEDDQVTLSTIKASRYLRRRWIAGRGHCPLFWRWWI